MIIVHEKRNFLPNGTVECFQFEIDTSKKKCEVIGMEYYFNTKLKKSWKEQNPKGKSA